MITRSNLLSLALISQLEKLSIRARRPVSGWGAGQRRSHRTGHSVEFADYRAYGIGDDMRYVDWSIYSRTGRMHVKLFIDDEDLCLHLLIDGSASMGHGNPSKLRWATELAAALSFVGLNGQERVSVGVVRDRLDSGVPTSRGRSRVHRIFDFLGGVRSEGKTNLNLSLANYAESIAGAGLAIVVSDLLDRTGYDKGLTALLEKGFEVHVVHVLSPEDLNPSSMGDVRLVDSETGEARLIRVDDHAIAAYRTRLNAFIAQVENFCSEHSIGYTRFSSSTPVDEAITRSLRGRILE